MKSIRWVTPRDPDHVLHIETPLGIVNIHVGLHDYNDRRVDTVSISPNRYIGEKIVLLDDFRLVEVDEVYTSLTDKARLRSLLLQLRGEQ